MKTPFEDAKKAYAQFGFELIVSEKDYKGTTFPNLCLCPSRKHEVKADLHYLKRKKGNGNGCKGCAKDNAKTPFAKVLEDLAAINYTALITEKDYKGVNKPFPGLCSRKHNISINMSDIYEGSCSCRECSIINRAETNMERRGVPNVSQDPTIRAKAMETNMKKRGVPYPLLHPEVKAKAVQTNMDNRGVPNPMQDPRVIEKRVQASIDKTGFASPLQNPTIRLKIIQTNMERRGVPNVSQDPEIKAQIVQTNMERRGVPCTLQDPEVHAKAVQTNMEKRGVPHPSQDPEVREKYVQTNLERTGFEYPSQDPVVKAKIMATNMERRGVPWVVQDPAVIEKAINSNGYRSKTYTFPSGNTTVYQGYEGMCLDDLIKKEGYVEGDFLNLRRDMPRIWYKYNDDDHRYFPDIYIPKERRFIEVKSLYYFNNNKEIDLLKQKACLDLGYKHEIRIYDRKGNYYIYKE